MSERASDTRVRSLPLPAWLLGSTRDTLRADLIAGLIVAAVLIPQAMAYATLANLPAIVGLYAACAAPVFYAIFATSRKLAVGPVALDSMLVATALAAAGAVSTDERIAYAMLLALAVGGLQVVLGGMRFGFVANFLSRPVVLGFTAGAALLIAGGQLGPLLGVRVARGEGLVQLLSGLYAAAPHAHTPTLIVGVTSVVGLIVLKRVLPRASSALVLSLALVISALLDLERSGVPVVGALPGGLPSPTLPSLAQLRATDLSTLLPAAFTIALVGFTEAIAIGRGIATPGNEVRPSRELVAIGVANAASGVFGGYPVTGGLSRTAINDDAGAQTPLAGIVSALVIGLALVFATGALHALPMASLGALVFVSVLKMVDLKAARRIYQLRKRDAGVLALTLVATALLGPQTGLILGVLASVLLFLITTSQPHFAVLGRIPNTETYLNVERHAHAIEAPEIVVLRIDAQLYFGNVTFLQDCVRGIVAKHAREGTPLKGLILEAAGVNQLDSAAAETLNALDEELESQGVRLMMSRVKGPVRDVMVRLGMLQKMAREGRIFLSTHEAFVHASTGKGIVATDPEKSGDPRALADRIGCGETAKRLIPGSEYKI